MENIYAALLLHKSGKEISEENLKSVVKAAGAEVDEGQIKSLVTSLKDVDIDKELESASLAPVGPASGGASGGEPEKQEEKKEEKKEEEKAPAAEGLSALFG